MAMITVKPLLKAERSSSHPFKCGIDRYPECSISYPFKHGVDEYTDFLYTK